jgi:hypothetical protein
LLGRKSAVFYNAMICRLTKPAFAHPVLNSLIIFNRQSAACSLLAVVGDVVLRFSDLNCLIYRVRAYLLRHSSSRLLQFDDDLSKFTHAESLAGLANVLKVAPSLQRENVLVARI